jgi:selenide,water dikinase
VDFFTPVVDDPYDYGAIAAANALSDVYSMGGKPLFALNIAALPASLPLELTQAIVRGAAEKAREAGVIIAGGHSVKDDEPKFGLVVLGIARNDRLLTKSGARPGDRLFLSKPLGTGVITTALKQDKASAEDLANAVAWMKRLNRDAAQLAVDFDLRGATDITGFGLLGHASEMAEASGVALRFHYPSIPLMKAAQRLAIAYTFPGGAATNLHYFSRQVTVGGELSLNFQTLLYDPQTSGGLLIAVPKEKAADFQAEADSREIPMWQIGSVTAGSGITVLAS